MMCTWKDGLDAQFKFYILVRLLSKLFILLEAIVYQYFSRQILAFLKLRMHLLGPLRVCAFFVITVTSAPKCHKDLQGSCNNPTYTSSTTSTDPVWLTSSPNLIILTTTVRHITPSFYVGTYGGLKYVDWNVVSPPSTYLLQPFNGVGFISSGPGNGAVKNGPVQFQMTENTDIVPNSRVFLYTLI